MTNRGVAIISEVTQTVKQKRQYELSKSTGMCSEINACNESTNRQHEVIENKLDGKSAGYNMTFVMNQEVVSANQH